MGDKKNNLEIDFLESIECAILAKTSDTQLAVLRSHMFIQLENGKMEKSLLMHTIPIKHRTIVIKQEQIKPEIEAGKRILLEKFRKFEKERKWTVTSLDGTKVYCARNPLRIYFDK
jgi:hypothetical protein